MKKYFLILFVIATDLLYGQVPVGQWRDHLPYLKATRVIKANNRIYCVANNNLYYYNRKDASINKLSKVKGLSDVSVSAIEYDHTLDILVVGYDNGNIDLLDKDGITNINAIEQKPIPGSKKVNNIYITGNTAFLATGFAVVAINLEKKEIKDTYYIGENGEKEEIMDFTSDETYYYALKKDAILRADKSSPYLIDYNQWEKFKQFNYSNAKLTEIEYFNGYLCFILSVDGFRNDTLYILNGNSLSVFDPEYPADYYRIRGSETNFLVSRIYSSLIYDGNFNYLKKISVANPYDTYFDENDASKWIASSAGLIHSYGDLRDTIVPNGPKNSGAYDFCYSNGTMWVAGGTPNYYYSLYGVHYLEDEIWNTIDHNSDPGLEGVLNVSSIIVDPNDPNHVFGGSNNSGLVEFRNKKVVKFYNENNSILKPTDGTENEVPQIHLKIAGMDYDSKGNLILAVSSSSNPIYILTPTGNMINLELNHSGLGVRSEITDLLVTSNDHIWVSIKNGGIFIIDINGTPDDQSDDLKRSINVVNQNGDLRNNVSCMVEDLDNSIWVGTGNGPVIFSDHKNYVNQDPELQTKTVIGYQVTLPDFKDIVQYLLVSDRIISIAIDGANRKWLGTESSGVYLVSPTGYNQIYNFRKENSPLFDNEIPSIGINDDTGEVFFATSYGIISFRADATEASDDFGKVYVFPNPVRSGYQGVITITGLASDVNVKITDISGNLVYETTALGGQATWNGKTLDGRKVHTGVYLVFSSNEDGTKTNVTKLLFIN